VNKVRYALAAAGLVPVTGALCIPPAMAATATTTPVKSAKTVSARFHELAPQSTPTSSPASSQATYCTGNQWVRAPRAGNSYIGFWYTEAANDTCIGTIKGALSDFNINYTEWRIRVWYNSGNASHYKQWLLNPSPNFTVAVHRPFPGAPHVCVAGKSATFSKWNTFYCAYAP
jgi:hypothetical protein